MCGSSFNSAATHKMPIVYIVCAEFTSFMNQIDRMARLIFHQSTNVTCHTKKKNMCDDTQFLRRRVYFGMLQCREKRTASGE